MSNSESPRFLQVPARSVKPRRAGITHVIDTGTPAATIEALLDAFGAFVDVWKFGFGTAYLDAAVASKIEVLRARGLKACPGGTLLEAAWRQGRSAAFFEWAGRTGFGCVEVSRGATGLPADAKQGLITQARARGFEVFAEIGSKDPGEPARPGDWAAEARRDIDSGASWLIAEGRESGTVGLYTPGGSVRSELVDVLELAGREAPVIYEAPKRHQQAWLINRMGANVNLANIAPGDVLGVEALRLGLRADTIASAPAGAAGAAVKEPCST